MLRALFFLAAVFALSSTPVVAGELSPTPIPVLIEQAKKALAEEDGKTYEEIIVQIFERITGFPASTSERPEGVSEELFNDKVCEFDRVFERIFTTDRLIDTLAITAFSLVMQGQEGKVDDVILATDCVRGNGRKSATNYLLREGIAWAKNLKTASPDEVRFLEQKYEALVKQHPQNEFYMVRAKIAREQGFINRMEAKKKEPKTRFLEEIEYQVKLVAKAYLGDLVKQLEVARRLETGDKFRQNNAKAYFWYKRALQNGGGETAQSGMDRLFPQLSMDDLATVEVWIENNGRPF